MDSERTSTSVNGSSSAPGAVSVKFGVTAQSGMKPADFNKLNLRTPAPEEAPTVILAPEKVVQEVAAVQEVAQEVPAQEVDFSPILPQQVETPSKVEPQVEDEFPDVDPKSPVEVNFKKLRSNYKAEREEHKKAKEALTAVQAELEDYRTGKKVPDALQSQEAEINRLREYEKVVSLKTSPEYQEKLVKPLNEIGDKLNAKFTDYELPPEVLNQVRTIKNEAQLNRFLNDHFDPTGALEVKALLETERKLYSQMVEAEKEPVNTLNKLLQEANQSRVARQRQEKEVIQANLRDCWAKSIEKIRSEGVCTELIHKANDSKYNEQIVNPIISSAAGEVSKLLNLLVESGLRELKPEVGEFISKMSLLAHSSAINAVTRDRAMKYAKELEANSVRENSFARPTIGGNTGASATMAKPAERMTPAKMAEIAAQNLRKK